jgi:hypothetical protein
MTTKAVCIGLPAKRIGLGKDQQAVRKQRRKAHARRSTPCRARTSPSRSGSDMRCSSSWQVPVMLHASPHRARPPRPRPSNSHDLPARSADARTQLRRAAVSAETPKHSAASDITLSCASGRCAGRIARQRCRRLAERFRPKAGPHPAAAHLRTQRGPRQIRRAAALARS